MKVALVIFSLLCLLSSVNENAEASYMMTVGGIGLVTMLFIIISENEDEDKDETERKN